MKNTHILRYRHMFLDRVMDNLLKPYKGNSYASASHNPSELYLKETRFDLLFTWHYSCWDLCCHSVSQILKSNSSSTTGHVRGAQRNKPELLKRARASAGAQHRINSVIQPIAGKQGRELSIDALPRSTITRTLMRNSPMTDSAW